MLSFDDKRQSADKWALVVEDVHENALLQTFELEDCGFKVEVAVSGEEALKLFDQKQYDVVLLDIHMPGIDGIETLRRFKQLYPNTTTAVIMVTGADDEANLELCLDLGAYDYIRKPVNFKEMRARVRSASRMRDAIEQIKVSEQKLLKLNTELAELAAMDTLSGCFNRRYFFDLVDREFSRSRRYNKAFTVMMIDIDHFKKINDSHGHAAGDKIITWLGKLLRDCFRKSDIIGRVGGEEFAVCCTDCDLQNALVLGERIREQCADARHDTIDKSLRVSVSIGISPYRSLDASFAVVLDRADKQLYLAKNSGRNRCSIDDENPAA